MKNIISAIYKKYKISIIGWAVTTISISTLVGFFVVWLSREGTTISNFLNGSILTMVTIMLSTLLMIGVSVMIAGEDHELIKLNKGKTEL